MSAAQPDFAAVLAGYSGDCRPRRVVPVNSAGGFSGSRLWRLETERGPLCLRCWPPEYPDAAQLGYIHRVLANIDAAGFHRIPRPISTLRGKTYVEQGDHLWELAAWLPGVADQPDQPGVSSSSVRIQAALAALAEFHNAANHAQGLQPLGVAPGLIHRREQLNKLMVGGIGELERQIELRLTLWPELADRSKHLLDAFRPIAPAVSAVLANAATCEVPIQPCIRDIHRDHVLFVGDRVTGIVDFGSMKPDSVACDIARLLGSMALDDAQLWQHGLNAYEQIRPLSDAERLLVRAYDVSAVLLSDINWLRWVFVEQRQFENRAAVLQRFDVVLHRLANLANRTNASTTASADLGRNPGFC